MVVTAGADQVAPLDRGIEAKLALAVGQPQHVMPAQAQQRGGLHGQPREAHVEDPRLGRHGERALDAVDVVARVAPGVLGAQSVLSSRGRDTLSRERRDRPRGRAAGRGALAAWP